VPLTREEASALLSKLSRQLPLEECNSCECLQGFLTQLEMDLGEAAPPELARLIVPREELHGCLGCDPCPPGDAYAAYLTAKKIP
jgi:hypothetical protein